MQKIKMSKLQKILLGMGLLAITFLSGSGVVRAAAGPFTCSSDFYQVISGQLTVLDPVTGVYTDIGTDSPYNYNAIGYDTLDNYIYGIMNGGPQAGDLIRISNDGTITDLGVPAGLPPFGYINGDFDLDGNLYIVANNDTSVYKINIASMTTTTLTISGSPIVSGDDNVYINNNLYLLSGSSMSIVNLTTDSSMTVTVSGPSGWLSTAGAFGAGWTDSAGELFFSNNDSGDIYQIVNYDTNSPTAVLKLAGSPALSNDGANCALAAQSPFDAPVANNQSYTTPFNTALNETATPLLTNDVGNSLTVTSTTSPLHGTVTVNPNGSFVYTPTHGFSGTDSFVYTVTDAFGRTASATATITVSPGAPGTGFGTPNHTDPEEFGFTSAALISICSGLYLLYCQRRTNTRKYRLNSY